MPRGHSVDLISQAAPGSTHLRVGVALTPAKGKRPTASAWALEAHDIRPDGTRTERLRASRAIATAATHPAHGQVTVAKRHTWQVAMQVAAGRALCYAEQLRRKGRRVTISLPSATTARDLQPTRPGETRPKTSHRDIACTRYIGVLDSHRYKVVLALVQLRGPRSGRVRPWRSGDCKSSFPDTFEPERIRTTQCEGVQLWQ